MFDYRYEGFIEKLGVSFTLIYLIFLLFTSTFREQISPIRIQLWSI